MYNLLIITSSTEGDINALNEQVSYLENFGIAITLSIDATEVDLLHLIHSKNFDCAYIHIKRRFLAGKEYSYDPVKVLEQKNIPTLGSSYITQLLISDKFSTSKKSGIGLPNQIISRTAFVKDCFKWENIEDYPVIIKPNTLHASMGISENSVARDVSQMKVIIEKLFKEFHFINEILIEHYVENAQEYTVSVIGNGDSLACSVSKLQFKGNCNTKINSENQKKMPLIKRSFVYTVEENDKIRQRLEYHAKTLFKHFKMTDIARFDFVLKNTYYLLEANTCPIPGNSFSWEWQIKYGLKKHQIISLYLCAFHFRQITSGKPSRMPTSLINSLPQELIIQINQPNAVDTCPECSGPTDNCLRPHLFSMNDRISSETEVNNFLKALTQLLKPQFILETGTHKGSSTIAFAEALRKNGFGRLVTLEIISELAEKAQLLFVEYPVDVLNQESLKYTPTDKIDLLFLDSKRDIRGQEFEHYRPYLRERAIIVWHDSSYREQNHSVFDVVEHLYKQGVIDRILFPTPRGLTLSMLKG